MVNFTVKEENSGLRFRYWYFSLVGELSTIMEIYFSAPDAENVSGDIAEALMHGVIRNLRAAVKDPEDYTARSNLMWEATTAENRIIKLNKLTDFQAHMVEALADFIKELGLPTTLKELGVADDLPLKEIASSVPLTPGGYGKLIHEDVLDIFQEAMG